MTIWTADRRKQQSEAMKASNAAHPEYVLKRAAGRYRGTAVSYGAAHDRACAVLPRECAICGRSDGQLDCALKPDAPESHIKLCVDGPRKGCRYSTYVEDYQRLCKSCHSKLDLKPRPRDAFGRFVKMAP